MNIRKRADILKKYNEKAPNRISAVWSLLFSVIRVLFDSHINLA